MWPPGDTYQHLMDRIAAATTADDLELLGATARMQFAMDARIVQLEAMIDGKRRLLQARRALEREVRDAAEDIEELD
jgi:hypothetical protein